MWIFDPETLRFLDVNHAAVRQYGYTREEFLAMSVLEIRPPEETERFRQDIAKPLDGGPSVRGVFTHRRKDGTMFEVEVTVKRVEYEGRVARLVLATDVTEREQLLHRERQARGMAEQANQAKTDFLATMSHELRTPLNAIGGYAELLEMGIHGPVTEHQRDALARIQRSQRHLLGLINDVLNFAKLAAGRVEYDIEELPVRGVIDAIEPLVSPQISARSLRFTRAQCEDGRWIRADGDKVRQILINLLSNAIKFTAPGGCIELACADTADVVSIAVRDTGIGIPTDRLGQIFEPFVQVDRRLNSQHEGTGLGLAISRDLARAMGGDITVVSEPGRGSTFTLELPRAQRA
jgi:PAS domain S-box-containing protein